MRVYVVTKGEYSGYHIITATTDPELAEAVRKRFDAEVEVFDKAELAVWPLWLVSFDRKGNVSYCVESSNDDYENSGSIHSSKSGEMWIWIAADSAERAVKTAAEKRAMFLVEELLR